MGWALSSFVLYLGRVRMVGLGVDMSESSSDALLESGTERTVNCLKCHSGMIQFPSCSSKKGFLRAHTASRKWVNIRYSESKFQHFCWYVGSCDQSHD